MTFNPDFFENNLILHRFNLSAVDAVLTGIEPISGHAYPYISILVEMTTGDSVTITKYSVLDKAGISGRIVDDGGSALISARKHGLLVGENVKLVNTKTTPSIDGNYAVTAVPNENQFRVAAAGFSAGSYGEYQSLDRKFFASTSGGPITESTEFRVAHNGGKFIIAMTAYVGANPVNIWVGPRN